MGPSLTKPFCAAMIVPTGIGASIGGFGGDATPHMNLLASVVDILITHPNVANAAVFQSLPDNAWYVEGYGLDQFFQDQWRLQPVRSNRIGVVWDQGIDPAMKTLHLNALNAVQTVYGVDILGHTETAEPVEVHCGWTDNGCSTGSLSNPKVILSACESLLQAGATAIALCVQMPTLEGDDAYKHQGGVDPIGGVEAILSHLVVSTFRVPCAHAPVFHLEDAMPAFDTLVDHRAAAEFIAPTFFPCVLTGLAKAPRFLNTPNPHSLGIEDLDALVLPADTLGGIPALSAIQRGIPIIAVQNNTTVLNVTAAHWAHQSSQQIFPAVSYAVSYEEAAGMLQAMRLGLTLQRADQAVPESQCLPAPG